MKLKLLLLLAISNFIFLSAQSKAVVEINYEMKQIIDSTNMKSSTLMAYTLLCNTDESVYYNKDSKNFYDALYKNKDQKQKWSINDMSTMPKFPKVRGSVYKHNSKVIVTLPIARDLYQFEEPILQWEILADTKEIKGFKCQLAKTTTDTNNTFYAWFTKDIPLQEGPFRFKGLSGLILEVYNKNKTIEIYATDIKKTDNIIEPLYYGKVIELKSKEQYLKTRANYLENPSGFTNNEIQVTDMNGNNLNKKIDANIRKINVFLD